MAQSERPASTISLVTDALSHISSLFQSELSLAKAEISEKIDLIVQSLVMIIAGAVLAIGGLFLLLQAAIAWLVRAGVPPHWATLIVAAVVLVLAAILVKIGLSSLKMSRLKPERTLRQLGEDAAVAKEQV